KMFMESGEFLWNTGLFLANVTYLRKCFHHVYPEVANAIAAMPGGINIDNALRFCQQSYGSFPNLSIDYAVLEHCSGVYVMKCDFGWADLGTWHSIYECLNRSKGDNVVIDSTVMMENCKNNVIKLPKGKLAVLNGLEGFIVAEKDNVLLICKKEDTSGQIRKYVNEAQLKYGEEFV
ncbi:MAG: mannose-1-phosphate guanylyltransferase, partial [Prevotella sp.]